MTDKDYIDLSDVPEIPPNHGTLRTDLEGLISRLGDQLFTAHQLYLLAEKHTRHSTRANLKEDVRRALYYLRKRGVVEIAVRGKKYTNSAPTKWRKV